EEAGWLRPTQEPSPADDFADGMKGLSTELLRSCTGSVMVSPSHGLRFPQPAAHNRISTRIAPLSRTTCLQLLCRSKLGRLRLPQRGKRVAPGEQRKHV